MTTPDEFAPDPADSPSDLPPDPPAPSLNAGAEPGAADEPEGLLFSDTGTDTPEPLHFSDTGAPPPPPAGAGIAPIGDTARLENAFESGDSPPAAGVSMPADAAFPQPDDEQPSPADSTSPPVAREGVDPKDDPFAPVTVGAVVAAAAAAAKTARLEEQQQHQQQPERAAEPPPESDTGKVPEGAPTAATPADMSDRGNLVVWFVHASREQLGPFSTSEVADRLRAGQLLPKHRGWQLEFGDEWKRLRDIEEFRPAIEALTGISLSGDDNVDRLRCTNCRTTVHDDWTQCPECGLQLKAELRPMAARIVAEPVHRAFAMAGGAVALLAMFLPWLTAIAGTTDPASMSGLHVPLGELLMLAALFLGFFTLQAMAGGPHRALLTWLIAVAAGLLAVLFWMQMRARLPGVTDASAVGARVALGFWVYATGVAVVLLANLVPALIRLAQRPLMGVGIVAVLAVAGLGVLQLVNGNLYEPLLRIQLESAGYTVEIDTLKPVANPDPQAPPVTTRTFRIRAWRSDGSGDHLYIGRHEMALGSLWPMRNVHLQAVPDEDQRLFPPRPEDDDTDSSDRVEGGTG